MSAGERVAFEEGAGVLPAFQAGVEKPQVVGGAEAVPGGSLRDEAGPRRGGAEPVQRVGGVEIDVRERGGEPVGERQPRGEGDEPVRPAAPSARQAADGALPSARNSLPISSGGRSGASGATSAAAVAPRACSAANAPARVASRTIGVPGQVTASASGWSGGSRTSADVTSSSPATTS